MLVNGQPYRTIWPHADKEAVVQIIDQRHLPFDFVVEDLTTVSEAAAAIRDMHVRGAGLIGATAGWGMYLAAIESSGDEQAFRRLAEELINTRPTAMNLQWAVDRQLEACLESNMSWPDQARQTAEEIADEDAEACAAIGQYGLKLFQEIAETKPSGEPLQILTHCNAGWLAFVDHGSATSPIYAAHDLGMPLHVWVDETRPRNQGARLTAWELGQQGIPHTVIPDNVGGHLMQHGQVDVVITGTDRTTYTGDVANKIGTYLKALAAQANGVPFYVALPSSTFDWDTENGVEDIPIEQRDPDEVTFIEGIDGSGRRVDVRLTPEASEAANYAFDVTPASLVSKLITERGVCDASAEGVLELFPERGR